MHSWLKSLLLLPLLALLLSACGASAAQPDDGRLTIVSTTGHIGDAVSFIAGDLADHSALLGPGIDPHTYVATEGDAYWSRSASAATPRSSRWATRSTARAC